MRSRLLVCLIALSSAGCWLLQEDPLTVAQAFWLASQEGDEELARSYVSESSEARITTHDGDSPFGDITLSNPVVGDERATVETYMTEIGEQEFEVTFQTFLSGGSEQTV